MTLSTMISVVFPSLTLTLGLTQAPQSAQDPGHLRREGLLDWPPAAAMMDPGYFPARVARARVGHLLAARGSSNVVEPHVFKFFRPHPEASVDLFSGESTVEVVDLVVRGRGLDLVLARKYRSGSDSTTAMGERWDHSYDVSVRAVPGGLELADGWGGRHVYALRPDGTYARPGSFLVGEQEAGGTINFVFSDGSVWTFRPLDGSPAQGKLASITDRNGNALTLAYDGQGRLATVTDTLGRPITFAYGSQGFLSSVTDFAGRTVSYEHYEDGDAGGSAGDLRSVTSPAVVGTPNGNDFPDGKTTTYAYEGHHLLAITDPAGQTWCEFEYSGPSASLHRRVTRQTLWPSPARPWIRDLWYRLGFDGGSELLEIGGDRGGRRIRRAGALGGDGGDVDLRVRGDVVVLNDEGGNVSELRFDPRGRLMSERRYTGRADPTRPTTLDENRPGAPLRPSDPEFFETTWRWNRDGLPVRIVLPDGLTLRYGFAAGPSPLSRGNLLSFDVVPAGGGASLHQSFAYDPIKNLLTQHVDARGNVTTFVRDPATGNVLSIVHRDPSVVEDFEYNAFGQPTAHVLPDDGSGHRRREELAYYLVGPSQGYPQTVVRDADGLALVHGFRYDAVGHVTAVVDPEGNDTLLHKNALGQLVRLESRAVHPSGNPVRYGTDYFYDASDRLVQVDVENVDELGDPRPNTHATTTYAYDALGNLVLLDREIDQASSATTAIEVEPNEVLVRLPEAVNGNQPENCVRHELDERGFPFRVVRAPGHADRSTVQYERDAAGRLSLVREGLESGPRETAFECDGLARLVREIDPMGNERTFSYDENGNVTSSRLEGELVDVSGGAGNVRLREAFFEYDEMDRLVRMDRAFFDPTTQTSFGDGLATTTFEYGPLGRLVRAVDDQGNETTYAYDTAARPSMVVGNDRTITIGQDESSNVGAITVIEHNELTAADEVYSWQLAYDELDRLIEVMDPAGNTSIRSYDSHHRLARAQDPEGHVTRWQYRLDSAPGAGLPALGPRRLHTHPDGTAPVLPPLPPQGAVFVGTNHCNTSVETAGGDQRFRSSFGTFTYTIDDGTPLVEPGGLAVLRDRLPGSLLAIWDYPGEYAARFDGLDPGAEGRLPDSPVYVNVHTLARTGVQASEAFAHAMEGSFERPRVYTGSIDLVNTAMNRVPGSHGTPGRSGTARARAGCVIEEIELDGDELLITSSSTGGPGGTDIVTSFEYDDDGRCTSWTDDNGNTTQYAYDPLNRRTAVTYADGTARTLEYDVHDDVVQSTDPNGTVVSTTYDGLDRPVIVGIVPGPGVSDDTTGETWAWDGCSRVVQATDDDSAVALAYDSLDNLRADTQNGFTTSASYDSLGNRLQLSYPSGGALSYAYDAASRLVEVSDASGILASLTYAGRRPVRVENGNGTRTDIAYDGIANAPGDSGVRRIVRTTHSQMDGTPIEERTYRWDSNQRLVEEVDVRPGGPARRDEFVYDHARLIAWTHRFGSGAPMTESYVLDGVGNRLSVSGGARPGTYTLDPTLPVPADFQVNQYTTTSFDSRQYDENGNTSAIFGGGGNDRLHGRDGRDMLVEVLDVATGDRLLCSYDCFGRRFSWVVEESGVPLTTSYSYLGGSVVEERSAGGPCRHIEVLSWSWGVSQSGSTSYFHHDASGNVIAVSDAAGQPVERYQYEPFGEPSFFDADGNPLAGSAIGNTRLWRGRIWETGAGLDGYLGSPSSPAGNFIVSVTLTDSAEPPTCTVFYDPRAGRNLTRGGTRPEAYVLHRGGDGNITGFRTSHHDARCGQDWELWELFVKVVASPDAGSAIPPGTSQQYTAWAFRCLVPATTYEAVAYRLDFNRGIF